ncbi:hypothetical protein MMC13_006066 [Lambiella insularis]|nr:hypothetical protein [Lambiella insularis]
MPWWHYDYHNGPYHNGPYHNGHYRNGPYRKGPYRNGPYHNDSYNDGQHRRPPEHNLRTEYPKAKPRADTQKDQKNVHEKAIVEAHATVSKTERVIAELSLWYQLRELRKMSEEYQKLEAKCKLADEQRRPGDKAWALLQGAYTDRIAAILLAMQQNSRAHAVLYDNTFMGDVKANPAHWEKDKDRDIPRLRILHRLEFCSHHDDKDKRDRVSKFVDELLRAVTELCVKVEGEKLVKQAEDMPRTFPKFIELLSTI